LFSTELLPNPSKNQFLQIINSPRTIKTQVATFGQQKLAEREAAEQSFSPIQDRSSTIHLTLINSAFLSFHVLERLLTFAANRVIVWGRMWGRIGIDGKKIGSFKRTNS
jgi:hypothetical protein